MTKLRFSRIPSEDRDIWLFSSDLAPFYWESHTPLGEVIPSLHMLPLIILLIWTVSWSRGEHVTCVEPARLFSWDIWIYTMESMLISLWWSTCELRGSSRFIILAGSYLQEGRMKPRCRGRRQKRETWKHPYLWFSPRLSSTGWCPAISFCASAKPSCLADVYNSCPQKAMCHLTGKWRTVIRTCFQTLVLYTTLGHLPQVTQVSTELRDRGKGSGQALPCSDRSVTFTLVPLPLAWVFKMLFRPLVSHKNWPQNGVPTLRITLVHKLNFWSLALPVFTGSGDKGLFLIAEQAVEPWSLSGGEEGKLSPKRCSVISQASESSPWSGLDPCQAWGTGL